jgi:hypothetical protein
MRRVISVITLYKLPKSQLYVDINERRYRNDFESSDQIMSQEELLQTVTDSESKNISHYFTWDDLIDCLLISSERSSEIKTVPAQSPMVRQSRGFSEQAPVEKHIDTTTLTECLKLTKQVILKDGSALIDMSKIGKKKLTLKMTSLNAFLSRSLSSQSSITVGKDLKALSLAGIHFSEKFTLRGDDVSRALSGLVILNLNGSTGK